MKTTNLIIIILLANTLIFGQNSDKATYYVDKQLPLYIGIENTLKVVIPDIDNNEIDLFLKNGKAIHKGNGRFIVNIYDRTSNKIYIKKLSNGSTIDSLSFEIKELPQPSVNILDKQGHIVNNEIIFPDSLFKLEASIPNFIYDKKFQIVNFSVSTNISGFSTEWTSNSNKFTQKQYEIMNHPLSSGYIYIDNIHILDNKGSKILINDEIKIRKNKFIPEIIAKYPLRDEDGVVIQPYQTLELPFRFSNNVFNIKKDTLLRLNITTEFGDYELNNIKVNSFTIQWKKENGFDSIYVNSDLITDEINNTLRKLDDNTIVTFTNFDVSYDRKKIQIPDIQIKIINQPRVALIIGNSKYNTNVLRNPVNDAISMSKKLMELGFEVTLIKDATLIEMKKAISNYGRELSKDKNTLGLFFYAGHGVQLNGVNYLIPVDADIQTEADIKLYSLEISLLMSTINHASNNSNIIILDACRNNPFERGFIVVNNNGLASIDAPVGTLISFATSPGSTASDGIGNNGLFTQELLKAIDIPDLQIEDIFKIVRSQVKLKSNYKQIPWESSSLENKIYLK